MTLIEWLEQAVVELRSGKYKQGRITYYRNGCPCALGVVVLSLPDMTIAKLEEYMREGSVKTKLPSTYSREGDNRLRRVECEIIHKNDTAGKDFSSIATYLRQQIELLRADYSEVLIDE